MQTRLCKNCDQPEGSHQCDKGFEPKVNSDNEICGYPEGSRQPCGRSRRWHVHYAGLAGHEFQPLHTEATFSDELKAFAAKLSDKLRDRAFDIESDSGSCAQSAALNLVADEIDEVINEGPNG